MCTKLLLAFLLCVSGLSFGQDIFTAVRSGDLSKIEQLYALDPDTINATNPAGFQPLMIACYRGQTDAAKLLVSLGANVNAVSPEGTALLAAAYQSDLELTWFLVSNGADCDAQGPDGNSALMYAVLNQQKDLVEYLLEKCNLSLKNKDGQTALSLARALENKEIERMVARKTKGG